jgi:hypothetical protein
MLSNHPNCLGGNGPSASSDLIGDVDGPASATDNAVARFDGTTGKLIQNSTVTIADTTGAIAGASSLTSPAATDLTLGTGTGGTALTLASSTLAATFAGSVTTASTLTTGASGGSDGGLNLKRASDGLTVGSLALNIASGLFTVGTAYSFITFATEGVERGRFTNGNLLIGTTDTTGLTGVGGLKINSSTAGAASAGALVVTGGLSAGGASYFGANVVARGALGYATGIHSGATTDSTQQLILSSSGAYSNAYVSKNGTTLGIGFSSSNGSFVEDHALSIVAATKAATFAGAVTVPLLFMSTDAQGSILSSSSNVLNIDAAAGDIRVRPKVGSVFIIGNSAGLRLGNAYVATPVVSTGYITIQDSTGTTYKVAVSL